MSPVSLIGMPTSPRHAHVEFSAPVLAEIEARRQCFRHAGLARRTVSCYESDWRTFRTWCAAAGRTALPASPDTVELYVVDLIGRGRRIATVSRHASAIQHFHRGAACPNPCGLEFHELLAGARRTLCEMPIRKDALSVRDLRRIVADIGNGTAIRARNGALLLLGFATALRRSSLSRLLAEDLSFEPQGVRIAIRHEKQDRKGEGRVVSVPYGKHAETCPVRALERWLGYRSDAPGPLFCHVLHGRIVFERLRGNRICQIVQASVSAIGLDPKRYGCHSLRAGFVSEGMERGLDQFAIARQTGHRSLRTLAVYMRSRNPLRGNACAAIGL